MKTTMNSLAVEYSKYASFSIPPTASIQKTTRTQWAGLWRAFRALRKLLGEKEALKLIETHCKHDATLILEIIL
jgi:hypothetical protein